ncbi:MAG: S-adenosyl-l-methionine hydroxide adenosyltransferase family protein [Thermoplasmata archaeon]
MIITLTTDFGLGEYVATMKGVILSIAPEAMILDISHTVHPQDIEQGAYVLYTSLPHFREGIHIAVIDPGVGTERKCIIVECDGHLLVGPDNGILMPAAKRLGLRRVLEIRNREYMLENVSSTFHGRDIFAPVAAYLSLGIPPDSIGEAMEEWVDLNFGVYRVRGTELRGKVLHVDSFGNLITNVPAKTVLKKYDFGQKMEIRTAGKRFSAPFSATYSGVKQKEILVTVSSSDFLEVAENQGNAAAKLGAKRGDEIQFNPAG